MGDLWDKAFDFSAKVNEVIYYDHVGSSKNKPIFGNPVETLAETTMAIIAQTNGSDEAARHHAKRAIVSASKTFVKSNVQF